MIRAICIRHKIKAKEKTKKDRIGRSVQNIIERVRVQKYRHRHRSSDAVVVFVVLAYGDRYD